MTRLRGRRAEGTMAGAIAGKANRALSRPAGRTHFDDHYPRGDGVDRPLRKCPKGTA